MNKSNKLEKKDIDHVLGSGSDSNLQNVVFLTDDTIHDVLCRRKAKRDKEDLEWLRIHHNGMSKDHFNE